MPSYQTPKKNTEFVFYLSLVSQANTKVFQTNPTLAAGDVKVSTDGGAEANIATLPVVTPAGSKRVKVTLSAAEMNGDNIQVTFSDAAGSEWCDLTVNIQTTTRQIDDLAFPATSGRGITVDANNRVKADAEQWAGVATDPSDIALLAQLAKTTHITGFNDLSAAQVQTEAEEALQTYHLDHLIASADPGSVVADSSFLAKLVSKAATPSFASYDPTTDSLEALRDRGDAAWATVTAAAIRSAVGLAAANLDTQLTAIDDFLDTEIAAIKAQTDKLTFNASNHLLSDIRKINDVTVIGAGTGANKWRA